MTRLYKLWDNIWDSLCLRFANWLDRREKKALLRKNICPYCEDKKRSFPCPVCRDVKIRPFTPAGRVTIRDRYKDLTGIDLFD